MGRLGLLQVLHLAIGDRGNGHEPAADGPLGNLTNGLLGQLNRRLGLAAVATGGVQNRARGTDQLPLHRLVAHDFGVVQDMTQVGDRIHQRRNRRHPAHPFQRLLLPQVVGDRDQVGRLAAFVQGEAGGEDLAVRIQIEVLRGQLFDGHEEGRGLHQHGAEDRALGLDVVRQRGSRGRRRHHSVIHRHGPPIVPQVSRFRAEPVTAPAFGPS
jgi:hypothetical protein